MTSPERIEKFKSFATIFIPLALLISSIGVGLALQQRDASFREIALTQWEAVKFEKRLFESALISYMADASSLAGITAVELSSPPKGTSANLALNKMYSTFAESHQVYDQVRYIDTSGNERVRINWNPQGKPTPTPRAMLQNKSQRQYFITPQKEKPSIYISQFDLNVENGTVETPFKPMLRIVSPVRGTNGTWEGFVVLNVRGQKILKELSKADVATYADIYLTNSKGQWLKGASPDLEWLFMFEDNVSSSMEIDFPDAWKNIAGEDSGQFQTKEGLFTFATIDSTSLAVQYDAVTKDIVAEEHWKLITLVPDDTLVPHWWNTAAWSLFAGLALAAFVSWIISRLWVARKGAIQQLRKNESQLSSITQTVLDAIIMVDQHGNAAFWNSAAEEMFGFAANEVLGKNIHDFIAPKALRDEAMIGLETFIHTGQGPIIGEKREVDALRSDGSLFPAELNISALSVEGAWWAVGVVRDITHRKIAEQTLVQLNEELEERVKTRTGELEDAIRDIDKKERLQKLLMDIASISNTAKSAKEAMSITLSLIAQYTGWPVGHIYLWSDEEDKLVSSELWHVSDESKFKEFIQVTQEATFKPGIGLPGRIYSSQKAHWIENILEDDNYPRAKRMKDISIRSAFGFPVLTKDSIPAIFEFYSETPSAPKHEFLEMSEQVSFQLGHVVERKRIEKEQAESEQLFRGIFEQSFQTIVILHPDGRSLKFNQNALNVFGVDENKDGDCYIWEYPRWNTSPGIPQKIREAVKTASAGKLVRMNLRLAETGKNAIDLDFSLKPIVAANGDVLFLIAEGRDITELAKVEAEVRKLAMVAERAQNGIIITDKAGRVEWVNEGFTRIAGYTLEEMVGKNPTDVLQGPETDSETLQRIHDALRNGIGVSEEIISYGKNEHKYWAEFDIQPILNEDGEVEKVIAIQNDITERKISTQELSRFKFTLDHTHDAVFIFDPESLRFTYANNGAMQQIGYSQDELLQMTPVDIKPEFDEQSFREKVSVLMVGERASTSFETYHRHKDGKIIPVDISLQYINPKNEPARFVAIVRDITETKRITSELEQAKNQAEAATRAKSDFLANMSHEIRTPMNAVIGMSHILLDSDLTHSQMEQVNKILTAATALLGIINDILDFSKIEAGKMKLEEYPFDLDDVLHDLAAITHDRAELKGLELIFDVCAQVPRMLIGDSLRIGQVLANLVGNAIKFTEKGSVVLKIENLETEKESATLKVSISDTGIGIAPEKQRELFEPFLQNDTSTTRKYGGTGLGLSICMQLVQMMGGEIQIDSALGKGSTFYFTLDLKCQSKSCYLRAPMNALSGTRVLIVDDSKFYRSVYDNLFTHYEFTTTFAETWQQAHTLLLEALENEPFNLLLLSLDLLGVEGFKIKAQLNEDKRFANLKIITITAFPRQFSQVDQDKAPDLVKPISQSSLFNVILMVFGKGTVYQKNSSLFGMTMKYGVDVLYGKQILVAEDNELNQEVARELLEAVGVQVTIVENGVEAVEAVQSGSYDLVVMDVQMPVMNGFEATRSIRKQFSAEELPIVAMTAHAMEGDREKSLESGMNDHVTKPVEPKKFYLALIRCLLDGDTTISLDQESEEFENTDKMDATDKLPSIPGLNTKQGMARVAGNRETYERLLKQYASNQAKIVDVIKEAIEDGRLEEARQATHALKGVSGNMGADALFNALRELENALKNGVTDEVDPLFEKAAENLKQVIQAIESYFAEQSLQEKDTENDTAFSEDDLLQNLKRLEELLADNDGDALLLAESIAEQTRGKRIAPQIEDIMRATHNFEFEAAHKQLREVVALLNSKP